MKQVSTLICGQTVVSICTRILNGKIKVSDAQRGIGCIERDIGCTERGIVCIERGIRCTERGIGCTERGIGCTERYRMHRERYRMHRDRYLTKPVCQYFRSGSDGMTLPETRVVTKGFKNSIWCNTLANPKESI